LRGSAGQVSEKDKDQPKGKGGEGKGDKAQAHGADKRDPAGAEKAAARAAAKEKKGGGEADAAEKPKKAAKPAGPKVPARVKERYTKEVVPALMKERNYPNVMAVPRLRKIVVNMGVGEATQNIKLLDTAIDELGRITGQRPAMRRSRKSIAAFRLRQGMPIAATVTLRGDRMYEFVDRLFNVALPRVRDFRGVPT